MSGYRRYASIIGLVALVFFALTAGLAFGRFFTRGNKNRAAIGSQGPAAGLPQAAPAAEQDTAESRSAPVLINMPEGVGHMVESYTAPGGSAGIIIHIQDIHTNYEAQKNLSKILESLVKENQLKLVMVEGGWGNVNLSYLRSYADSNRRQSVADDYLREGKISGEEYLDIVSDYDIRIEGAEDEDLYRANLDTFFAIEVFRNQAVSELSTLNKVIEEMKQKIYTPQLAELERVKASYDNEKMSLAEYYKYLYSVAERIRHNTSAYPNFLRFMSVVESESAIKFTSAEKERAELIEQLSKTLPKQDLAALVTKSLEFKLNKLTPVQYHDYLIGITRQAGLSLQKYKNLEKYITYIRAHDSIDTAAVFEEANALLHAAESALIQDARQQRLYDIARRAQILENFLHLKLVPDDFSYYKNNRNDFVTAGWIEFLQQQAQRNKLGTADIKPAYTLDKNLSTLVRFYDLANDRDDAFMRHTLRLMKEESASIAVLIAGGFHTPNIKQKFKEHSLSYVVIAPYTNQQTDMEQYRYILRYKSGKEE
ncbi:MAG: hypothetical protein WC300_04265 [Candidatus Omnitrophota bacterium]|jgi:hypothetical protein